MSTKADNRIYRTLESPGDPGALLSGPDCREFSHALADTLCWFAGFRAAHAGNDDKPELPPGIEALRSLNIRLKAGWKDAP